MDIAASALLEAAGFTPLGKLGQGSFGSVFHCTNKDEKDVAVKMIFGDHECKLAATEAAVMSSIAPHPNILPLLSFEEYDECSIMALPLATGGDTLKLMQERSLVPLPTDDARNLFRQLVDAVSHMHKNGFVHRDIKCENVLLAGPARRSVLLADFGFATRWADSTMLQEPWGSLHYSSPEIAGRREYKGPEVDVWSLGVVLYAWCTGRLPFSGANEAEICTRIEAASYILPSTLPSDVANLISCMLTADPAKRITIAGIQQHPWLASRPIGLVGSVSRSPSDVTVARRTQALRSEPVRRNSIDQFPQPSRLAQVSKRIVGIFRKNK